MCFINKSELKYTLLTIFLPGKTLPLLTTYHGNHSFHHPKKAAPLRFCDLYTEPGVVCVVCGVLLCVWCCVCVCVCVCGVWCCVCVLCWCCVWCCVCGVCVVCVCGVCVCVCVCVSGFCGLRGTNLSNNMGMTEVLQFEGGLWGHCLCPRNSKGFKHTWVFFENLKMHTVSCEG